LDYRQHFAKVLPLRVISTTPVVLFVLPMDMGRVRLAELVLARSTAPLNPLHHRSTYGTGPVPDYRLILSFDL